MQLIDLKAHLTEQANQLNSAPTKNQLAITALEQWIVAVDNDISITKEYFGTISTLSDTLCAETDAVEERYKQLTQQNFNAATGTKQTKDLDDQANYHGRLYRIFNFLKPIALYGALIGTALLPLAIILTIMVLSFPIEYAFFAVLSYPLLVVLFVDPLVNVLSKIEHIITDQFEELMNDQEFLCRKSRFQKVCVNNDIEIVTLYPKMKGDLSIQYNNYLSLSETLQTILDGFEPSSPAPRQAEPISTKAVVSNIKQEDPPVIPSPIAHLRPEHQQLSPTDVTQAPDSEYISPVPSSY